MTCRIISINITKITFQNYQINVHHIVIKYSLINVFVLFFICSIIENIYYKPVIVTTKNLRVIAIIYSTIS